MLIHPRYIHHIEKPLQEPYIDYHYWIDSSTLILSEDVILRHADELDWPRVSKYSILTEKIVSRHRNKIYWHSIYPQKYSFDFCNKYHKKLDFNNINYYNDYDLDFKDNRILDHFNNFHNKLNKSGWSIISEADHIPMSFIEKFKDKINWKILNYDDFSEEDLEKYKGKVNWFKVCKVRKFKKSFIGKFGKEISASIIKYAN